MKPSVVDLTGLRFGMLVAVSYAGKNPKRTGAMWKCKCDCGASITASADVLRKGDRKTCGCSTQKLKHRKHGYAGTPTYIVWQLMIRRCHRPANDAEMSRYMGRGIAVCDAWRTSFESFIGDMGERPPGHQIDRIDNDKGYSPENCRWVTPREQALNKSTTRWIEFKGQTRCLQEWADLIGISAVTLHHRLGMLGWTKEQALTTPCGGKRK